MADNLDEILALLDAKADLLKWGKFDLFKPYAPQMEFFKLSATKREILLMAGNQCGKTEAGAFATTCHLTGQYPAWWPGKRFSNPTRGWAGGEGGLLVRDVLQAKLCGTPGSEADFGSGYIPKALLAGRVLGHGVSDGYDSIRVKHVSGGVSILSFKTYDQGRSKWQSSTLDFVWTDEEPPDDIYGEALTRLTGPGVSYTTCTPLKGPTDFIRRFTEPETADQMAARGVARMGLRHAEHFTEAEKQQRLAGYDARDRAARENGDPILEGGAVFRTSELDLKMEVTPNFLATIPFHWVRIWGVDFGFDHPFAAALCAWDREADIFYVLATIRMRGTVPIVHADAMKRLAVNVPVAWPHDGHNTEKGSGDKLADIYRAAGKLNMLDTHATHAHAGGYEVWPGLTEMDIYMRAGRFKVAETCREFFEEYRTYRSDGGKIVKVNDDVIDAVRCAFMMRRRAKVVPLGSAVKKPRRLAREPTLNPWTGRPVYA